MKHNFGVLYRYECKKLLNRKIVWISISLCLAIILISLAAPFFGNYYIDGKLVDTKANMYQKDKEYAKALSGRTIDQSLLEEMIAGYQTIPATPGAHYTSTEEYQKYARPYSEIFNFVHKIAGVPSRDITFSSWHPTEESMYLSRTLWLQSTWESSRLSKGEMEYWQEKESQIPTPYIFQAYEGYSELITSFETVGIFVLMIIAICLSGMFSDEHVRKTDQLILSSPLGKRTLYWAKIAAGISFAAASTILFFVFTFTAAICLHGPEGFQAAFQFIYPNSSAPINCGQAVLIAYGNLFMAAVLISIFVMVLSELLHSNIAALAISTGFLFLAMMVTVPEQYRVLAQIWDWLPWCFITPWNVFGQYTLPVFGQHLAPWQAVPVIYLFSGTVLAAVGKPVYQRFQVSGR